MLLGRDCFLFSLLRQSRFLIRPPEGKTPPAPRCGAGNSLSSDQSHRSMEVFRQRFEKKREAGRSTLLPKRFTKDVPWQ